MHFSIRGHSLSIGAPLGPLLFHSPSFLWLRYSLCIDRYCCQGLQRVLSSFTPEHLVMLESHLSLSPVTKCVVPPKVTSQPCEPPWVQPHSHGLSSAHSHKREIQLPSPSQFSLVTSSNSTQVNAEIVTIEKKLLLPKLSTGSYLCCIVRFTYCGSLCSFSVYFQFL